MKNIKLTSSSAKERLAAEQEASLLSQLQHPNIVGYKESFQDEFGVFFIYNLPEGVMQCRPKFDWFCFNGCRSVAHSDGVL